MMDWFTVTRCSGDKCCVGEFVVEDRNGNEWQVRTKESKRGGICCLRPVVCMNAGYEAGIELEGDICDAVKEFVSSEDAT